MRSVQGRNHPVFSGGGGKMMQFVAAPNKYIRLWKFREGQLPDCPPIFAGLGQRMRWSALADKIKTIVLDKKSYRGTQSQTCVVDERSAKSSEIVPEYRW